MVERCDALNETTKAKYIARANNQVNQAKDQAVARNIRSYFLGQQDASIYTGYRIPDFAKLTEMVVFFAEALEPDKTKMNKLLFYADFFMLKQTCFSISGVRYVPIDRGPVPDNFASIFDYMKNEDAINITYSEFPNGTSGEQFGANQAKPFDETLFSESEIGILKAVAEKFKDTNTIDLVNYSHLEEAWLQNHESRNTISYNYAFGMKGL